MYSWGALLLAAAALIVLIYVAVLVLWLNVKMMGITYNILVGFARQGRSALGTVRGKARDPLADELDKVRNAISAGHKYMLCFGDYYVDAALVATKSVVVSEGSTEYVLNRPLATAATTLVVPPAHAERAAWFVAQLSRPEKKK